MIQAMSLVATKIERFQKDVQKPSAPKFHEKLQNFERNKIINFSILMKSKALKRLNLIMLPFLNLELIFCKSPTRVVASELALLGRGSRVFPMLELT